VARINNNKNNNQPDTTKPTTTVTLPTQTPANNKTTCPTTGIGKYCDGKSKSSSPGKKEKKNDQKRFF